MARLLLVAGLLVAACGSAQEPVLVNPAGDSGSVASQAEGGDAGSAAADGAASTTDDGGQTGAPVVADTESEPATRPEAEPSAFTVVAAASGPSVTAHTDPDDTSPVVEEFANPTAVGSPLVFRAVSGETNGDWIQVHLPVQPNGTIGWVRRGDVTLSNNPFRIEIERASYALRVYNQNSLWLETEIAVGTGDTPTPVGDFYLLELLAPADPSGPYGPFAFGLSGFSEVLDSFGGADTAIIGLHGTNDPASLGTDVSHGCIRIENSVIEQLAVTVPLGTPVLIT